MSWFRTRRHVLKSMAAVVMARWSVARAEPSPTPGRGSTSTPSPLDSLLRRRRMIRRFRSDPVSDATVNRLIATATRAPSAGHTEPWAFVAVRDARTRSELGRAAFGQMFVAESPLVVVACADLSRSRAQYGERGNRYGIIDASFASLLLLLAVVDEGLGACFVGAFEDAAVSRLLRLPADVQPIAIIPIGMPAESPPARKRRPVTAVLHRERW